MENKNEININENNCITMRAPIFSYGTNKNGIRISKDVVEAHLDQFRKLPIVQYSDELDPHYQKHRLIGIVLYSYFPHDECGMLYGKVMFWGKYLSDEQVLAMVKMKPIFYNYEITIKDPLKFDIKEGIVNVRDFDISCISINFTDIKELIDKYG